MTRARAVAAIAAALLAIPTPAASVVSVVPAPLPLSAAQVAAAGAAGVGCSWEPEGGGGIAFAAADDRAVVRLRRGVVRLRPARRARGLFPFTFDRWVGGGLVVTVLPTGASRRRGGETLVRPAILSVSSGRMRADRPGRLDCGA